MTEGEPSSVAVHSPVRRLNWGCGSHAVRGWINADRVDGPEVDLACDIRTALPIESDTVDYAVSVHALQELAYEEVVPALIEVARVLKPGGVLRLVLPDLDKGIRAYVLRKPGYFRVETDVTSPGGRFITHMLWYGHSRMLFTSDFVEELLREAHFVNVSHCWYRETASLFPEITELDSRPLESLYIEATKPVSNGRAVSGSSPPPADLKQIEVPQPTPPPEPEPEDTPPPSKRIEVTEVALADDVQDRLLGFRLRKPTTGLLESRRLPIVGWVVGRNSPAAYVEVLHCDDQVARARVEGERPLIAERFKDIPHAERPGFEIKMEAAGSGDSNLQVNAVLEDETRVPVATISMRIRALHADPDARKPVPDSP